MCVGDYLENLKQMEKLEAYSCFLTPLQEFFLGGASCVSASKPCRTASEKISIASGGDSTTNPVQHHIHHINNNYSATFPRIWKKPKQNKRTNKQTNLTWRHHVPAWFSKFQRELQRLGTSHKSSPRISQGKHLKTVSWNFRVTERRNATSLTPDCLGNWEPHKHGR